MENIEVKEGSQLSLSETDYLTGLANRRGLSNFYLSLGQSDKIHAMYIDVDNFKRINDEFGHSMGDRLLVCVSGYISKNAGGFVSRVGGDEFVAILDGRLSEENVIKRADDLIAGLEELDFRKDILVLISLSVGIVLDQSAEQSLDGVLSKCDAALYQSKYNGKKRSTVYKSDDKSIQISRNIELEMEDALKNGQFKVFLQPKVNMITSAITGAEALSRWEHPSDGLRMPDEYIPVFEKNGFISKLDMYMFKQVCMLKKSWEGEIYEHLPVSVNMSRFHLYNKNFPDELAGIVESYGVDPEELELEITESVFIKDTDELIVMVKHLQEKGFKVSIDDFGSGYSALSLIKDLTVDTVKLDKYFLHSSANDMKGKIVLKSVISMCRDLKITVVTEGVENDEQIDFLTRSGCQVAQGFYYSEPVPVDSFVEFAKAHLSNILSKYRIDLGESLVSDDGHIKGRIVGEGLKSVPGIFKGSKAMHFPGGPTEENMIEIDPLAVVNDSWTVSFWCKTDELHMWSSVYFMKFETGFASFNPLAWEGHSDFRIRDSREVNGWYDSSSCQLEENLWWHIVITYNSDTETAISFINGDPIGQTKNVPVNRFVKRIVIGGDVFQKSYIGSVCELVFYNEAKDYDFVRDLFREYTEREDFAGGPLKRLI
ncbi:MAG: EAL domain-containing protein [Lachnospiraceae bacterium]|nr:EAL domain-containing protein [Lachnospiraceae bacterium]